MAYVPSFFFARQQFLLPRKAFWDVACPETEVRTFTNFIR